ncbi:hypothetical protein AB0B28_17080 [Glycomyces sp. NPDC046736]|uniref:hypothetical protein n=1 Tax=Glycomyces sp. NPDC046736 TaxID=3155615 RepID=UPI003411C0B8
MTAFPPDVPPSFHHTAPPPGPRKPGAVLTAQIMLWIQFGAIVVFLVLSCSFVAVLPSEASDFLASGPSASNESFYVALALLGVFLLMAVLFAVIAAKIGSRRRWARVFALVLLPIFAAVHLLFSLLVAGSQPPGAAFGLLTLFAFALAPVVVAFICLLTAAAKQWCTPSADPDTAALVPQY